MYEILPNKFLSHMYSGKYSDFCLNI